MAKLTDGKAGTIAKAEPPAKGQRFIFDDHRNAPPGFALRVTSAGGRAFVLNYSADGRQRRKTIGPWPLWSLEAARDEARKIALEVGRGHDPLEEKRRRRAEPTVADIAEEWLTKHATGLASAGTIRAYVRNDITPALGRLRVTEVTRRDVIALVEAKAEKAPRAAAQLLIYARKVLDYAADRGVIPANPAAGLRPSSIVVRGRKAPLAARVRARVLVPDEIRSFWSGAETCGMHRLTALCLKLVLVTGQRPGEVAGMHEREIDGRTWTIPAARRGKTDTSHTVYLSDTALALLDSARAGRRGGYIFAPVDGAPITNGALARAVRRCSAALGARDDPQWGPWRPHDLRRTMRTGLSACRIRPDIAEMTVGHAKRGIVAVYDLHGFEAERRAALEAWEARLLRIVAGVDPDAAGENIVRMDARR